MSVKDIFSWEAYQPPTNLHFDSHDDKRKYAFDLNVVAIDGEGYNTEDGDHHYDLIAATGADWEKYLGTTNVELTVGEIFEFLLGLTDKYGRALYFIYGGSYDFNMWVKRLPEKQLKQLRETGRTRYSHYKISWTPRREILIQDRLSWECKIVHRGKNKGKHRHNLKRRIHIYDVIGFFQSSFVKALEDWNTVDEQTLLDIAAMKKKRGSFTPEEKAEILKYCLKECHALVQLGTDFKAACTKANIRPTHWYGAGALAATLMRNHGIKQFIAEAPEVKKVWTHAYFGGRTEVSYQGRLPLHGAYQYDINSAYPTAMFELLPCLVHGEWRHLDHADQDSYKKYFYSIWRVQWNTHGKEWNPFPWRAKDGRIFYPDSGHGWYHKVEIDAAEKLYPDCVFSLFEGWAWIQKCKHRPFEFIKDRAEYRLKLKAESDPANKPLKLGLNSLYGKTAQTVGKNPPYQNFYWAGLITAATRAKLLDAMRFCSGHIYSVATDGLLSSVQIEELKVGPSLGEWEQTKVVEGFIVRPGVYKWLDPYGKWHYGTRGFSRDEADWNAIEYIWDYLPVETPWKFKATRFITLSAALNRGDKWREVFGKWITEERRLSFVPTMGTRTYGMGQEDTSGWLTRWGTPFKSQSPHMAFNRGGFQPLKYECHCSDQFAAGVSTMYERVKEGEIKAYQDHAVDEDQPS